MVLSGDSGVVLRSLVHQSFHIRNAHSDIMIRNRQEAPWRTCLFSDLTFRRGRAMMVVVSRHGGQVMFFLSHISLVPYFLTLVCFAVE